MAFVSTSLALYGFQFGVRLNCGTEESSPKCSAPFFRRGSEELWVRGGLGVPGSLSHHDVRIRDSKFTLCSKFEDSMHISCRFVSNCANEQRGVLLCAARVTTGQE